MGIYDNFKSVNAIGALGLNTKVSSKSNLIKEKYNSSFIPILYVNESLVGKLSKYEYKNFIVIDSGETVELSVHLDKTKRKYNIKKIKFLDDEIIIPLKILQGNIKASDNDGIIKIVESGVKILSKKIISIKYDQEIALRISNKNLDKNAKIDFYASDDGGYFEKKGLQNIFCGSLRFTSSFSKIGNKLTKNIEELPLAPIDYISPPTFSEPQKSFDVANKYQDCGGMCFAVSMARVAKAFKDTLNFSPIKVETVGQDYLYSGTVVTSIPDKYFGYGVGGALSARGYAELIDHKDIVKGLLNEGAMLQYWNNPKKVTWEILKKSIKNSISGISDNNFSGGHSVIFKSYSFDSNGVIDGLNCYDYTGINRNFKLNENKIYKGANILDHKKY